MHKSSSTSRILAVLTSGLLILSVTGAFAVSEEEEEIPAPSEYDSEGNAAAIPTTCPAAVPSPGWQMVATNFYVRKWNQPAGDEVRFFVTSISRITTPGPTFTWFRPNADEVIEDGITYSWQGESDFPHGGVQVTCHALFRLFGLALYKWAWFTGSYRGYAIPVGLDQGGGTGGGGERETSDICIEYYEWWIDALGHYQETVLATWCLGEFEI